MRGKPSMRWQNKTVELDGPFTTKEFALEMRSKEATLRLWAREGKYPRGVAATRTSKGGRLMWFINWEMFLSTK
jgi:hypothetical protein